MTEGNFVDYVKIYVASGKGGKGLRTYTAKNLLKKEVRTAETVVAADTYI